MTSYLLELLENHKTKFRDKEYVDAIEELGRLRENKIEYKEYQLTFLAIEIQNEFQKHEDNDVTLLNKCNSNIIKFNYNLTDNIYKEFKKLKNCIIIEGILDGFYSNKLKPKEIKIKDQLHQLISSMCKYNKTKYNCLIKDDDDDIIGNLCLSVQNKRKMILIDINSINDNSDDISLLSD